MKNILNLYLIIFCLFFVAGCSSDDDAATVKLTIIKSDLDMKASGGIYQFHRFGRIDSAEHLAKRP